MTIPTEHGVVISPKTDAMLFSSGRAQPVHYDTMRLVCGPISLTPKGRGGRMRVLGLALDPKLSFVPHAQTIIESCEREMDKLRQLSYLYSFPRLRIVFRGSILARILYGAHLYLERLPSVYLDKLCRVFEQGCRIICGTARSARTGSCVAEAGFRPLPFLVLEQGIRFVFRVEALPSSNPCRVSLLRRGGATTFPRRYMPPRSEIPPVDPAMLTLPYLPEDTQNAHKVEFLTSHTAKAKDKPEVKLAECQARISCIGPVDSELWTDGSVQYYKKESSAGAAYCLYVDGDSIPIVGTKTMGDFHCAFSSEVHALGEGTFLCRSHVRQDSTLAIYTDSLSTLKMLSKGPLRQTHYRGAWIWKNLLDLASICSRIVCAFVFGHCKLVRGEHVDGYAKAASNRPIYNQPSVWSVDVATRYVRLTREEFDGLPSTIESMGFRGKFVVAPSGVPPLYARHHFRLLFQLRTGVCAKLGGWRHEVADLCPRCGEPDLTRGGGAIRHVFTCAATASLRDHLGIQTGDAGILWTDPPLAIKYVTAFML
jgi:hypothetical protein